MIYTYDTVIWGLNVSTLENKLQRVVTVCNDFGLNVNLDTCIVIKESQQTKWKR
jgi:hypothetical protein